MAYPDIYFNKIPKPKPTTSSGMAGGVGLFTTALSTILGTGAAVADIKAKRDALIRTMEGSANSLKYSQYNKAQKLEDLNRIVGDKLSATGLEALKAESRLKAASAETGTSGTTNLDAVATADVNKLHQDAAILREADIAKTNTLTELVSERLSFEASNEGLLSGQPTGGQAALGGLNTSLQGFQSGLNFLTSTQKEDFLGINTTGVKNG